MHRPEDAVVVATIPFGTVNSIVVRGEAERILQRQGIRYRVVQDALTFTPGPQLKRMFIDREPPRLYLLVQRQDYETARAALAAIPKMVKHVEAQAI